MRILCVYILISVNFSLFPFHLNVCCCKIVCYYWRYANPRKKDVYQNEIWKSQRDKELAKTQRQNIFMWLGCNFLYAHYRYFSFLFFHFSFFILHFSRHHNWCIILQVQVWKICHVQSAKSTKLYFTKHNKMELFCYFWNKKAKHSTLTLKNIGRMREKITESRLLLNKVLKTDTIWVKGHSSGGHLEIKFALIRLQVVKESHHQLKS